MATEHPIYQTLWIIFQPAPCLTQDMSYSIASSTVSSCSFAVPPAPVSSLALLLGIRKCFDKFEMIVLAIFQGLGNICFCYLYYMCFVFSDYFLKLIDGLYHIVVPGFQ